jgi:hypothetical protein
LRKKRFIEAYEAAIEGYFPHPAFYEAVCKFPFAYDEHEKAGLLTSRSSYWLNLPAWCGSGSLAFVLRYSGVTVWDFHPFPYSPYALT